MQKYLKQGITLGLLATVLFALQLFAFTEPTSTPPLGNVSAPLNVSPQGQFKSGGLILNTGGTGAEYGLIVDKGNVGIGTANPNVKLNVAGDTDYVNDLNPGVGQIWITGSTNSNNRLGIGYDTTDNFGFIAAATYGSTWRNLALQPNGGNVGIGTTIPGQRLDVAGQIHSSGDICTDAGSGKCLSSAGGLTSCPAGMNLIGLSGSANAFCAENDERGAQTWSLAAQTCRNLNRRLCAEEEFYTACISGSGNSWTNNYEFTSELHPREGCCQQTLSTIMGGGTGGCISAANSFVGGSGPDEARAYRCCSN